MTLRAATHGVGVGRLSVAVGLDEGDGTGTYVPSITVNFSPTSFVEGEEVTMTLSEVPDTVTVSLNGEALSVAATGTERTYTQTAAGIVNIVALKADFRAISITRYVAAVVVVPTITQQTSPDPLVANEPFTLTFTPAVDEADASVSITGSGETWNGTAPASGPVAITAQLIGYQLFEVSKTVDTAVITPTAPITPVQMYDGQTVGEIPNFASINSTSY